MTEATYKALPQIMRVELRGYRKRRRLTIADVAAQLGLHEHTIRRWESGMYAPTTTELDRWARVLGLQLRMELVDTVPVPALVESVETRYAFEAPAECRLDWTPPDVEGITLDVVERDEGRIRLRLAAVARSGRKARAAIRAIVDAPAFRRQCEVGPLTSVAPAEGGAGV